MADRDHDHMDFRLKPLAERFFDLCLRAGLDCRRTTTWRDPSDQNAAKANGLSKAAAGQSPHNCVDRAGKPAARAFDFGIFDNGKYVTDGKDFRYTQAGMLAETIKDEKGRPLLFWGGRWTKEANGINPDYPHVQLMAWRSYPTA